VQQYCKPLAGPGHGPAKGNRHPGFVGCKPGRLIRQLLVESFVLSAGGCALGCWFAYFGLKELMAIIPQGPLPDEADVGLNAAVLLFALGITVLTTILNVLHRRSTRCAVTCTRG